MQMRKTKRGTPATVKLMQHAEVVVTLPLVRVILVTGGPAKSIWMPCS
jgi:hypothetical protein